MRLLDGALKSISLEDIPSLSLELLIDNQVFFINSLRSNSITGKIRLTNLKKKTVVVHRLAIVLISGQCYSGYGMLSMSDDPEVMDPHLIFKQPIDRNSTVVFKNISIRPGSHEYEFSLNVPINLPPTMRMGSNSSASISHMIHICSHLSSEIRVVQQREIILQQEVNGKPKPKTKSGLATGRIVKCTLESFDRIWLINPFIDIGELTLQNSNDAIPGLFLHTVDCRLLQKYYYESKVTENYVSKGLCLKISSQNSFIDNEQGRSIKVLFPFTNDIQADYDYHESRITHEMEIIIKYLFNANYRYSLEIKSLDVKISKIRVPVVLKYAATIDLALSSREQKEIQSGNKLSNGEIEFHKNTIGRMIKTNSNPSLLETGNSLDVYFPDAGINTTKLTSYSLNRPSNMLPEEFGIRNGGRVSDSQKFSIRSLLFRNRNSLPVMDVDDYEDHLIKTIDFVQPAITINEHHLESNQSHNNQETVLDTISEHSYGSAKSLKPNFNLFVANGADSVSRQSENSLRKHTTLGNAQDVQPISSGTFNLPKVGSVSEFESLWRLVDNIQISNNSESTEATVKPTSNVSQNSERSKDRYEYKSEISLETSDPALPNGISECKSSVPPQREFDPKGDRVQLSQAECTFEAIDFYHPIRHDELAIETGDHIFVKQRFGKGWSFGLNLRTRKFGLFPLTVLGGHSESVEFNGIINSDYSINRQAGLAPRTTCKPNNSQRVAQRNFFPNASNDLFITAGDPIMISNDFRNGWGYEKELNLDMTPRKRKIISDRFINCSGGSEMKSKHKYLSSVEQTPTKTKRKTRSTTDLEVDKYDEESLKTYHDVIVNELLPSASSLHNSRNKKAKTSMMTFTNELSPTVVRQALLSPLQKFNPYTLTPTSQTALLQPKKSVRYISKTPYKVLDAPELQDDFYLNLVDWSKLNFLGVGLGTCVYLWSANNSKVDKLCDLGPYDSVTSGSHIAVGTNRGLVQLWDVQKMKKIRQFTDHKARVGSISWNESLLTSGSRDRSILLRDVRDSSDTVRRYTGHRQEVCGLKWNPEGNQLASGGNDNKLLIWDIRQTSPITQFSDHIAAVKAISWSPHTVYIYKITISMAFSLRVGEQQINVLGFGILRLPPY
ncbi:substrate-specific activator of APC-dependent proteolysis [Globomyces sp. JEL0801]|nr:substrate-specific activator of APC-dependent proteolysis [Globomyces sp. JEL0801]